MVKHSIRYGRREIHFELKRSDVTTLSTTVRPDGSVVVVAPQDANESEILKRLGKRSRWIVRKQERFLLYVPKSVRLPERTGESIRFLGRQYRVRVVTLLASHRMTVARNRNVLEVRLQDPTLEDAVKTEIDHWWHSMAKVVITERFERCVPLVPGVEPPGISIRKMLKRWGSFTPNGRILINPELIAAPVDCIDYVIIHELCHVLHPNHQRPFYRMLESVLPDWKRRKERLENCET